MSVSYSSHGGSSATGQPDTADAPSAGKAADNSEIASNVSELNSNGSLSLLTSGSLASGSLEGVAEGDSTTRSEGGEQQNKRKSSRAAKRFGRHRCTSGGSRLALWLTHCVLP